MNLTANKFCLENARELVLFARMAYDEPATIQSTATDTQVLIRDLPEYVVVAFRGTSSVRDFVTDAEAWIAHTLMGGIHHGFWNAWESIAAELYEALKIYGRKPIFLTGHSLGGSLAMIAARVLRNNFVNVHSVYTFGAPRVGEKDYQTGYNACHVPGSPFDNLGDATFTLINDVDIIPRIPSWLAHFRRPGRDEFIDSFMHIYEDPSLLDRLFSDLMSLAEHWLARRSPLALDEILTDHHVDNYIEDLNKVAPVVAFVPEAQGV